MFTGVTTRRAGRDGSIDRSAAALIGPRFRQQLLLTALRFCWWTIKKKSPVGETAAIIETV